MSAPQIKLFADDSEEAKAYYDIITGTNTTAITDDLFVKAVTYDASNFCNAAFALSHGFGGDSENERARKAVLRQRRFDLIEKKLKALFEIAKMTKPIKDIDLKKLQKEAEDAIDKQLAKYGQYWK